jgi:hypothetical protein
MSTELQSPPKPPKKSPVVKLKRSDISRVMAEMGRRGGRVGGKRRLITLTPEKRKEIAANAANKRWEKAKGNS